METKILKFIMLACLIAGMPSAFAQTSLPETLLPGSCSHNSKNPQCWENHDRNIPARPTLCLPKSSCNVIESVQQDNSGLYHCLGPNGHKFSCNKLVEEFGVHLEGTSVKITTPYFDRCHVLGGCGARACGPGYGIASLDPFCQ